MIIRPFLVALQFLTRIPTPSLLETSDQQTGRSILFYPLIGLLIGLIILAVALSGAQISSGMAAALSLAIWVLITGGLHLDGLADSADAWVGGYGDRERTLSIMKEPCSGPAAVMLVTIVLIIKFAALDALISHSQWVAILLAPVLGRTILPILFLTTPYVRKAGLGSTLTEHLPESLTWRIIAVVALTLVLIAGQTGAILFAGAAITLGLLRILMVKRLGGTTGDTAGAAVEITEMVILTGAAFLLL